MDSISSISLSALSAYGVKQAVTSNNIANMNTTDYKASTAVTMENKTGGVSATVVPGNDEVDISKEAVDLLANSIGFKANLKVFQATDEMYNDLLKMKP
ncbi:MAG TPA: flagellar basal body protein [Desulfuromonadaceae bacterium]|jgi:flagellar basal-body rod protein FlgC